MTASQIILKSFQSSLEETGNGLRFLGNTISDSVIIAVGLQTITGQNKTSILEASNIRTLTADLSITNVRGPVENRENVQLDTRISL